MLAYLDADMELCVLDTRAGAELEHASLSTLEMTLSPILPPPPSSQQAPTTTPGREGRDGSVPSPALATTPPPLGTYHNAFRACEGRLYLLGRQELRAVRVQSWSRRVESLVQAGEWLEALAVALDHYEQKILPAETAAAAATASSIEAASVGASGLAGGEIAGGGARAKLRLSVGAGSSGGLASVDGDAWGGGSIVAGFDGRLAESGRGSGLRLGSSDQQSLLLMQQQQQQRRLAPRSEAAEHISDLLTQYLRLAINNAPAAETPPVGGGGVAGGGSRINLAHSHFQMLAGVCTEFCAVTGRLDMLFGQVFQAFRARGQQG